MKLLQVLLRTYSDVFLFFLYLRINLGSDHDSCCPENHSHTCLWSWKWFLRSVEYLSIQRYAWVWVSWEDNHKNKCSMSRLKIMDIWPITMVQRHTAVNLTWYGGLFEKCLRSKSSSFILWIHADFMMWIDKSSGIFLLFQSAHMLNRTMNIKITSVG